MNQILKIDNKNISEFNRKSSNKKRYYFQFVFSVFLIFVVIICYFFTLILNRSKDITAKQIANNYDISKLYNNADSQMQVFKQGNLVFSIIGMIEIPKINIYYPIISEANEELLKIAPCRIAGPMPNEDGNLCIAGHNYDNYKFFSKISELKINDDIIVYDINKKSISYKVIDIYEVSASDLTPIKQTDLSKKQLTLITCNNFNSDNRIIVKASNQINTIK
ncbi:MAG: sortase [Clostridia bacterium]|nr:sortase [Clostridia bacterium]